MNVNADSPMLIGAAYEEYVRYERYLALACGIGFLTFTTLLLPGSAWGGSLAVLALVGAAFRKYHVVIHRFVGAPTPDTDQAVQLWGTAAQACVWGAAPVVLALCVLQVFGG